MATTSDLLRRNLHLDVPIDDVLDVRKFTVNDGLSTLFNVDVEVRSHNPALDFEELIGKPATFRISLDPLAYDGLPARSWSGILSEAHLLRSESTGLSTYRVTVAPKLWLLTLRTNCRVFQQQSDLDIVKTLLKEWGSSRSSSARAPTRHANTGFNTRRPISPS